MSWRLGEKKKKVRSHNTDKLLTLGRVVVGLISPALLVSPLIASSEHSDTKPHHWWVQKTEKRAKCLRSESGMGEGDWFVGLLIQLITGPVF